jgi:hypothetical protein
MFQADRVSHGISLGVSLFVALVVVVQIGSAQTRDGQTITGDANERSVVRFDVTLPQDKPCRELSEEERRKTERCKTEAERREEEQKKRAQKIADREKPTKTSFWRRVHLDLPGIRAESGKDHLCCSVIGIHLIVAEVGRLQLYGPPGVLLVRQKVGSNNWQWRGAYSWGLGWYLDDVTFPLLNRPAKLYFNLTKVWTTGGVPAEGEVSDPNFGVSMVGLSVVFAK